MKDPVVKHCSSLRFWAHVNPALSFLWTTEFPYVDDEKKSYMVKDEPCSRIWPCAVKEILGGNSKCIVKQTIVHAIFARLLHTLLKPATSPKETLSVPISQRLSVILNDMRQDKVWSPCKACECTQMSSSSVPVLPDELVHRQQRHPKRWGYLSDLFSGLQSSHEPPLGVSRLMWSCDAEICKHNVRSCLLTSWSNDQCNKRLMLIFSIHGPEMSSLSSTGHWRAFTYFPDAPGK